MPSRLMLCDGGAAEKKVCFHHTNTTHSSNKHRSSLGEEHGLFSRGPGGDESDDETGDAGHIEGIDSGPSRCVLA